MKRVHAMRGMSKTLALFLDVPLDSEPKRFNLSHICRMSEALPISEAARRAGIDRRTLQRWHRQGLITLDAGGRVTMESVQAAMSRPKKAGRPAGQRTERLDVLRRRADEAAKRYFDELVKKVPADKRAKARAMILQDNITGQPMGPGQAEALIQEAYLKPLRWEKEWKTLIPQLLRKTPNAQFVAWEKREEYVMGDALPQGAFARAEEYIDAALLVNSRQPVKWGELAVQYGVHLLIAPALASTAKHLVLVDMKLVKLADRQSPRPKLSGR
jgi:hypothetical protein